MTPTRTPFHLKRRISRGSQITQTARQVGNGACPPDIVHWDFRKKERAMSLAGLPKNFRPSGGIKVSLPASLLLTASRLAKARAAPTSPTPMKLPLSTLLFIVSIRLLGAQSVQPDFALADINPSSVRNTGLTTPQIISPRHYRQQISVYYFSQEYCPICQTQFTSLQELSNELQTTTDLPVVIAGIHLFEGPTNPAMYTGKSLSWVRETATVRPWQSWRVPIASRPAREIRWRDVIILDENNAFYAVQNLTDSPITDPLNRTRLKNTLRAAATIVDSDSDGINDRWEFAEFGSITPDSSTPTPSGLPALAAYAFGLPRGEFHAALIPSAGLQVIGGKNYLQFSFRRRLGGEGTRLGYLPQTSTNFTKWTHLPAEWIQTGVSNPYDGSGTEIVTVRRTAPIAEGREFVRLNIGEPLP